MTVRTVLNAYIIRNQDKVRSLLRNGGTTITTPHEALGSMTPNEHKQILNKTLTLMLRLFKRIPMG